MNLIHKLTFSKPTLWAGTFLVVLGALDWNLQRACAVPNPQGTRRQIMWQGPTMGTSYQIKLVIPSDRKVSQTKLVQETQEILQEINQQMSTYLPDSEISQFNRAAAHEWFSVSQATAEVSQKALEISQRSEGAYDITIGPLVQLWHFGSPGTGSHATPASKDAKRPESPLAPPEQNAIEEVQQHIGYRHLEVRFDPPGLRKKIPELEIDLSSIAKGYAVDRIAQWLEEENLLDYMVEIGGEIRAGGVRPDGLAWKIGIERPDDTKRMVQRIVPLKNQAIATSGDYRIFFMDGDKRYSHLIDPRSGRPVSHALAAATVLGEDCMEADALATTLLILGPEEGAAWAKQQQIAALLLFRREGKIVQEATPQFEKLTKPNAIRPPTTRGTGQPADRGSFPGVTLLLAVLVIAISLSGMAAGVIFSNRRLHGSCGGLAGIRDAQGNTLCDGCTNPAPDCQSRPTPE